MFVKLFPNDNIHLLKEIKKNCNHFRQINKNLKLSKDYNKKHYWMCLNCGLTMNTKELKSHATKKKKKSKTRHLLQLELVPPQRVYCIHCQGFIPEEKLQQEENTYEQLQELRERIDSRVRKRLQLGNLVFDQKEENDLEQELIQNYEEFGEIPQLPWWENEPEYTEMKTLRILKKQNAITNRYKRRLVLLESKYAKLQEQLDLQLYGEEYNFEEESSNGSGGKRRNKKYKSGWQDYSHLLIENLSKEPKEFGVENTKIGDILENSYCSGIKGLINNGNTCFFNSIMQCLSEIPQLRDHLICTLAEDLGTISSHLREFYIYMWKAVGKVYNPIKLCRSAMDKIPMFWFGSQQDSHEFMMYLLDTIHTEEMKARQLTEATQDTINDPKRTIVDKLFRGTFSSTCTCLQCGNVSTVYEHFNDLSLIIHKPEKNKSNQKQNFTRSRGRGRNKRQRKKDRQRRAKQNKKNNQQQQQQNHMNKQNQSQSQSQNQSQKQSQKQQQQQNQNHQQQQQKIGSGLDLSLKKFVAPERLNGSNAVNCDNCTKVQLGLIDENNMIKTDTIKKIVIEKLPQILIINLKRFSQTMLGEFIKNDDSVSFPEILNMKDYSDEQEANLGSIYQLFAITIHHGSLEFGHYTSFVLKSNKQWYDISDAEVTKSSISRGLNKQAYILFYKKINKNENVNENEK
ncbi:carboxyl-terminal hydrolase [Anaeramoeba flamelloides]|uniref:Ubiquitin carboxyl-terminal hydrolase n=1 Tax=Anaeramoeba flamelloides TaxID=1746091 RepID=A0ABQ8YBZ2_9EUKA|nr:carboxyl-terminal hydrolase [Anaeramoeba flamelloides]